ncbi:MAG TPA: chaperone NapD [Azonexus sp.]
MSPTDAEVHIAGVLVQARPGCEAAVADGLAALPRTEIHGATATGKFVAVCEGDDAGQIMELLARMRGVPGVVDVALVYQHAEAASAMQEECPRECDPT